MDKNGVAAVVIVITAVVLAGLWVMRSGQNRPDGLQIYCSAPPGAPGNFAYTREGSMVRGTWTTPDGDNAPTAYVVEVGSRPGSNDQGTFIVPATETSLGGETPPGTYYGRVYARNACGSSPASNEIGYSVP